MSNGAWCNVGFGSGIAYCVVGGCVSTASDSGCDMPETRGKVSSMEKKSRAFIVVAIVSARPH